MSEKLPFRGFKFVEEEKFEEMSTDFILNYLNGDDGYVYEVDLDYPTSLHDAHNAYPLAPE